MVNHYIEPEPVRVHQTTEQSNYQDEVFEEEEEPAEETEEVRQPLDLMEDSKDPYPDIIPPD